MARLSCANLLGAVALFAGTAHGAHAACDTPVTSAGIMAAVEKAEAAYTDLDEDGFRAATGELLDRLPCAEDQVTRPVSAAIHRMQGLRAFVLRDLDKSHEAFAAARALEPAYRFPEEMINAESPVLEAYHVQPTDDPVSEPVPEPAGGRVSFDGLPGHERPTAWPTIAQVFDDQGSVRDTAYLWPGDPLPDYEVAAPSSGDDLVEDIDAPSSGSKRPRIAQLGVAGGLGLVAGALYGVAAATRSDFDDPRTRYEDLDGLKTQVNAEAIASGAVAATALGLGVVAFVSVRW